MLYLPLLSCEDDLLELTEAGLVRPYLHDAINQKRSVQIEVRDFDRGSMGVIIVI